MVLLQLGIPWLVDIHGVPICISAKTAKEVWMWLGRREVPGDSWEKVRVWKFQLGYKIKKIKNFLNRKKAPYAEINDTKLCSSQRASVQLYAIDCLQLWGESLHFELHISLSNIFLSLQLKTPCHCRTRKTINFKKQSMNFFLIF